MARLAVLCAIATLMIELSSDLARGHLPVPATNVVHSATIVSRPLPPANRAEERSRNLFKVARAEDGMFHVPASVNGKPVRFIVDTGANVVVIAPSDLPQLGLQDGELGSARTLTTASGQIVTQQLTLRRLDVGGQSLRNVSAVVGHEGLSTSLLGQSALARLGPIIMNDQELSLGADWATLSNRSAE